MYYLSLEPTACNSFHDILMMSIDINNIALLNTHGVNYCSIIIGITKSETII